MAQTPQQNSPPESPGPRPRALIWPPIGVRDVDRPDAQGADMLAGHWVTSFTGWQRFDPLPVWVPGEETQDEFQARVDGLPPLIGGYGWDPPKPYDEEEPGSYHQREGYFLCSALVRIALDGYGGLKGVMEFIRGGRGYKRRILTGSYTIEEPQDLPGTYEGTITETHPGDNPDMPTSFTYAYVLRDLNEMSWIWKEGNYRPFVASGTFKRVRIL